jgi:ATP-dependent DNA ligase
MEECSLIQRRTGRDSSISLYSQLYPAKLIVHDVSSIAGIDISHGSYFDRMDRLKPLIEGKSSSILIIGNSADGIAEWESVIKRKMEGLIVRDPKAPLGQKVFKLKRFFTEDVYCKGEFEPSDSSLASIEYEAGGNRYKGLFANIACYQRTKDGKEVKVCDLGGGFEGPERIQIQKMLTLKTITKDNPLVIEIKANMRYPNLKLRHATFLRIRDDKPWSQCTITEEP